MAIHKEIAGIFHNEIKKGAIKRGATCIPILNIKNTGYEFTLTV